MGGLIAFCDLFQATLEWTVICLDINGAVVGANNKSKIDTYTIHILNNRYINTYILNIQASKVNEDYRYSYKKKITTTSNVPSRAF